jgi:DNA polymerase sigma
MSFYLPHNCRGMPTLNPKLWTQIDAYRAKYPKKFAHFDNQIFKHYERNLQNDATFAWKMQMRMKILNSIREYYDDAELFVVGSTINGCGSFNADMDLCCSIENTTHVANERKFALKALYKIKTQLFRHKLQLGMSECLVIPAKVPIIRLKFNHPYENLEVDLNVNNLAGVYNSYLLHYYSRLAHSCTSHVLESTIAFRHSVCSSSNGQSETLLEMQ